MWIGVIVRDKQNYSYRGAHPASVHVKYLLAKESTHVATGETGPLVTDEELYTCPLLP